MLVYSLLDEPVADAVSFDLLDTSIVSLKIPAPWGRNRRASLALPAPVAPPSHCLGELSLGELSLLLSALIRPT
jgi:hypothetical protein